NGVKFKASKKVWDGGGSAAHDYTLPPGEALNVSRPPRFDEQFVLVDELSQTPLAGAPYRIEDESGAVITSGVTDQTAAGIRERFEQKERFIGAGPLRVMGSDKLKKQWP
ncbi:hypothetical protein, partial [Chitinimonas taiwanensis]|uniref:hypothetical protein n=1 Tax=Chitinimonas taiwanensis TaxID=240412 RepID=UPI0035AE28D6